MNVAAEPLSRLKIRRITRELREIAGCEDSLFFPIVHFIEWVLANPINGMELEIVEPEEMEDTYGTTNTGSNVMRIRSDVYERAVLSMEKCRKGALERVGYTIEKCPNCNGLGEVDK